jgi:glycosyltransferase involved in cell wall biosynthesis
MYNEVESIELMINKLNSLQLDFIVVDNHSSDGCCEIALKMGAEVHQRDEYGSGYGCAIMKGFDIAHQRGFSYLGIVDCDVTYNPEYFFEMIRYIPEYQMVLGVRSFKNIAFLRRLGNNIHTYFTSILYASNLKDVNTGLRLVDVAAFRPHVTEKYMGMVPQMTSFALRNRLKIKEIPIEYQSRLGTSKLNKIKDGWEIAMAIWRERWKKRVF